VISWVNFLLLEPLDLMVVELKKRLLNRI
ncbi:uncharacterized protein METZ01_LOCUS192477, partial [marine metagenome]